MITLTVCFVVRPSMDYFQTSSLESAFWLAVNTRAATPDELFPMKHLLLLSLSLPLLSTGTAATALAQESRIVILRSNVVTQISGQETNVLTRIERLNRLTGQTNVIDKTRTYRDGTLAMDHSELDRDADGSTDVRGTRVYHDRQLVIIEMWDGESKVTQRTILRESKAVVTEIDTDSDGIVDLLLIHGENEEVAMAFRREKNGKYVLLNAQSLREIQHGTELGTEFGENLLEEHKREREVGGRE